MRRTLLCCCSAALACLFVLVLTALPVRAQYEAGIHGTVTDASGGAIPGAKVALTDQATNVSKDTTTDDAGFYRFVEVAPGSYTITVDASGFKQNVTKDVAVQAEVVRGLDIKLELGQQVENVTVSASVTPVLRTEDANVSGTLSTREVQELPKFNRDPYELLRLAPGVFGDGARSGAGQSVGFPNGPGANSGSAGPGGSNTAIFQTENQQSISSNGQRITSNNYAVDGVSVNSLQFGGAAVVTPSPDSVQEITILSNDYDASDGRSSGAHIKVVTKGGTNQFHGAGFFQYEEPGLNAFNKFNGFNEGSGNAPTVRNNDAFRQFGGDIGGPILKDKLFFFFNYEGLRDRNTTSENNWVETPQFDALLLADRPGTAVATTLSSTGIAPRVAQVLAPSCALWIAANQPCAVVGSGVDIGSPGAAYGTYIGSFSGNFSGGGLDGVPDLEFAQISLPARTTANQYNARVDYIRGRNTFSGSTFLTYFDSINADGGAQGRPGADFNTNRFSPSAFLGWISVLSPTLVNEARVNFTRFGFNEVTANPNINFAIPRTEIQGLPINGQRIIYGAAQGDTSPGIFAQNTFAFRDLLSQAHNQHTLKYGVEIDREEDNNNLLGGARPDYVFQEPWNFANGTPIFEAIAVNPLTGAAPITARYYREGDYGLFIQDDWKARPNLTLNLGLRWEYYGPPSEARGQLENIIPGPGPTGLLNAKASLGGQQYNPTYRNFGPRVAFAWSPSRFESKAVVRGGFGIAYDRFDDVSFDNTRDNPPITANYGICCGTAAGEFGSPFKDGQILYATGTAANNPASYPANPALATPLNPLTNLPEILPGQGAPNVFANPLDSPIPYVYLYSLQVQYSLPSSWVATVGYQGSSSHKLLRIKNLQFFYPQGSPLIGAVFSFTPDTNANFNALLTQLEHRFGHGFLANFSYTYSKSIDQVSAEGPGFVTNQTFPTDDSTERGPSDYDVTHYFRAYGLWDLPIFRDRTDWLGKVAGGWELSPVFEFHSGFPWTPVDSNNCAVVEAGFLCPVRPIGYNGGAGSDSATSAFLPPTSSNFSKGSTSYFNVTGTPGVVGVPGIGRNSFRGPRYTDIDFSVVKRFGLPSLPFLGEGARIEIRANFYNAFNKLNLAPFTFDSTSTSVSFGNNSAGPVPNPLFGTASAGLAGRVIELQGRFVF